MLILSEMIVVGWRTMVEHDDWPEFQAGEWWQQSVCCFDWEWSMCAILCPAWQCIYRWECFIKLYNPYIVFSLFWYHIEYLVYTYRCSVLIYLSTWMLIAEMKASDDYDDNIWWHHVILALNINNETVIGIIWQHVMIVSYLKNMMTSSDNFDDTI